MVITFAVSRMTDESHEGAPRACYRLYSTANVCSVLSRPENILNFRRMILNRSWIVIRWYLFTGFNIARGVSIPGRRRFVLLG